MNLLKNFKWLASTYFIKTKEYFLQGSLCKKEAI